MAGRASDGTWAGSARSGPAGCAAGRARQGHAARGGAGACRGEEGGEEGDARRWLAGAVSHWRKP